jgi:hypothetical protein
MVVGGHVCPYCGVIDMNGLTAFQGDFTSQDYDRFDFSSNFGLESSQEMFLCHACGAIMVLKIEQELSTKFDGGSCSWAGFRVGQEDAAPGLVAAMQAKYLTFDKFEPLTWVKIPAWKIRCARGALRGAGPNWVGVPGDKPGRTDSDSGSEDDDGDSTTPVLMCDSYSLTHPVVPYPKTLTMCKDHFMPAVLGSYVVHLFLEPNADPRQLKVCVFNGSEEYDSPAWEKAALMRLGMPLEAGDGGRGGKEDEDDDSE